MNLTETCTSQCLSYKELLPNGKVYSIHFEAKKEHEFHVFARKIRNNMNNCALQLMTLCVNSICSLFYHALQRRSAP